MDIIACPDKISTCGRNIQDVVADKMFTRAIAGTGSFGKVRLVRHKATNHVYAMKQLSKSVILRTKQLEHMMAEKNILAALRFPFIVQLYATLPLPACCDSA